MSDLSLSDESGIDKQPLHQLNDSQIDSQRSRSTILIEDESNRLSVHKQTIEETNAEIKKLMRKKRAVEKLIVADEYYLNKKT